VSRRDVATLTSPPPPAPTGFTGNVLRTFAAQSLIFPIHALTGILTARLLGPHDRGLYSLLLMIPQTLDILLRLGIAPANVYMICREKVASRDVVSNSVLLAFGLGGLALLLLPFRHVLGETMLANVDGWYLTLAVLMVPFYIAATYLTSILFALNQFQAVNRQTLIGAAARLLGIAAVLLILHKGLFEAFLINVVGSVLAAAWLLSAIRAVTPL
jgi:hypothetical protein